MNQFENNTISMHCDFTALYHSISSKLEEFKKFISKLLVNENSQLLDQYSYYYNALFELLSLFDEFKNECRALLKTNRIIEYIFRQKKLTPYLRHYVNNVWKSFSNLLKSKLNLLKGNISNEDYENAYSKFRDELSINSTDFYSEIYVQTHEFDDEIRQIKTILF